MYDVFRLIMNVILIIIGIYCTLRFFGYFKNNDIRDDFVIAYVAVFMAMFGALINISQYFGYASVDDVLLST